MGHSNSDQPHQVAEQVWSIPLALPADHPAFVSCYVIRDGLGDPHLIDPGWADETNWALLTQGLKALGWTPSDICSVTLTHQHSDHIGQAASVREVSGCPIFMHPSDQVEILRTVTPETLEMERLTRVQEWQTPEDKWELLLSEVHSQIQNAAPRIQADVLVEDGEFLTIPGLRIRVRHTPGHTPGHICLEDAQHNVTFSGDHVLPGFNPGVGLGRVWREQAMVDYLASLSKTTSLQGSRGLPGHGAPIEDLAVRSREIESHHSKRIRQVRTKLLINPDHSTWTLAQTLTWSRAWHTMTPTVMRMVLCQTEMYRFASGL